MTDLYEVLELALHDLEYVADVESVLRKYPEHAAELRPILLAALHAQEMSVPVPSTEVVRRNRARVLQRAAQMREASVPFQWGGLFRRFSMALALLALFLFSGTSLVRAASTSLPGDNLYQVKRSWEDLTLALTFNGATREKLEVEYENERLSELQELFNNGRAAQVDFAGLITRENGDGWWISNVLVIVTNKTQLPGQPIQAGMAVRIYGFTRGDGIVIAERIEILPLDAALPEVEDKGPETVDVESTPVAVKQTPEAPEAGHGSVTEAPEVDVTSTPAPVATLKIESFEGTITSIEKDVWIINGQPVNVSAAEIRGVPAVGAIARVEGYQIAGGKFMATRVEIRTSDSGGVSTNSNSNDDDNGGSSGNTNSHENENGNNNNTHEDDNNNNNAKP